MSAMFSYLLLVFALSFTATHALPLNLAERDAIDPPITSPSAGDVWHVGDTVTVTWVTAGLPPPANVTNPLGTIILGFLENDSENLMLNTPLAKGFSIFTGSQEVTVPDVPPRKDYIIALLGDSGNISLEFQIVAKLSTTPSPPIAQSSSATPVPGPTEEPHTSTPPSSTPSSTPSSAPSSTPATTSSSINESTTLLSTPSSTPVVTPTSPTSPVTSPSTTPGPQAANANTNDALSFKQVKLSSVAFTILVAFSMI